MRKFWKICRRKERQAWVAGQMAQMKGAESGRFCYVHPGVYRRWLERGPCESCPGKKGCNEICRLRAIWWDAGMAQVRKRL